MWFVYQTPLAVYQVEQPASSSLISMPYVQHLLNAVKSAGESAGEICYKRL